MMIVPTDYITSYLRNEDVTMLRVIPAVVFDYLEFSALAFGGIGAGDYEIDDPHDPRGVGTIPNCIMGYADTTGSLATVFDGNAKIGQFRFIRTALHKVGICEATNDHAISNVHQRLGRFSDRISFKAWCEELNVVRGE